MAATLKIRIGASIDNSLKFAFRPLEKSAQDARKAVNKELRMMRGETRATMSGIGKEIGAGSRAAANAAARGLGTLPRAAKQTGDRIAKEMNRGWTQIGKAAQAATRQQYRELQKQERQAQRSNQRMEQFARRTSHRATRFMFANSPLAPMAKRAAGDIARGAGVDMDVGSSVQRTVALEASATKLSNQGYQEGDKGANGKRIDPAKLQAEARSLAAELNIDPQTLINGMEKFVDKTGDLDAARKSIREIAKVSLASGADLEETAEAAGQLALQLEGVSDKGAAVSGLMKTFAGQGKLGAVELKDLAVQMGKLTASASQYEGDREGVIKKLGAFGQIARQYGGATSGAEAANSVARFGDQLRTPARRNAMRAAGVEFENKDGQLLDPMKILKNAIGKTGGDTEKMNAMFKSTVAGKMVNPLTDIYKQAGGGDKGMAALDAAIAKFTDAAISGKEVDDSIAARNKTVAARAQKFQNQWDATIAAMAGKLLPAMEKLGPSAIKLAETLGNVATWTAENPKAAIAAGIVLAISRAGIESAFRAGIEKAILGSRFNITVPGGVPTPGGGATPPVFTGPIALAVGALTVAAVGKLVIDQVADTIEKTQGDNIIRGVNLGVLADQSEAQGGAQTEDQRARTKLIESDLEAKKRQSGGGGWKGAQKLLNDFSTPKIIWDMINQGPSIDSKVQGVANYMNDDKISADIAQVRALLAQPLTVKVSNMPEKGPEAVGPSSGPDSK